MSRVVVTPWAKLGLATLAVLSCACATPPPAEVELTPRAESGAPAGSRPASVDSRAQASLGALNADTDQARIEACASVAALGSAAPAKAVPALREALLDPEPRVRAAAARALGAVDRSGASAPDLARCLKREETPPVRLAASQALAQQGSAALRAAPALASALDDKQLEVCLAAARSLRALGPLLPQASVAPVLSALAASVHDLRRPLRVGALRALRALGERAAPATSDLSWALATPELDVRVEAAKALRAVGEAGAAALDPLRRACADEAEDLQLAAVEAIAAFGEAGAPAAGELARGLSGSTPVALACARALAGLPAVAAASLPALLHALRADSLELRCAAAEALQAWGPARTKAALPALIEALEDPSPALQAKAAAALAAFGPGALKALGGLLEGLSGESKEVRAAAAHALWRLGPLPAPSRAAALSTLRFALKDELPPVRHYAALALGGLGLPGQSLAEVGRLLADAEPAVRAAAARALGEAGARARPLRPRLQALQKDPAAEVRAAATQALGQLE